MTTLRVTMYVRLQDGSYTRGVVERQASTPADLCLQLQKEQQAVAPVEVSFGPVGVPWRMQ